DVEDDARYPPSTYPSNPHHRHPPIPNQPQFSRNFADQDDDYESESNSDGINNDHNADTNNSVHYQPHHYVEQREDEEPVDDNDNDEDNSSLESRGKRRKLDNFEFVPRKPPPIVANSKPAVKNSPPDWSEESTFILLDAWGDLFVKNGSKSLRSDEWSEVAKKVNQASRITRSDSQCRNRLDTLKKKYKKEKARMTEIVNFKSDWVYFEKMDSLMPSTSTPVPAPATKRSPRGLACGVDAGEYVFPNSRVYLNRANATDEMRDSPGDTGTDSDDESDGLPPMMSEKKKVQSKALPNSSFRMLAESIQKFGEVYEKIENSKRQQMVELERMRKEFHRDLEVQKRQILERAQAEIVRIRQEQGEDEEERMTEDSDGDDDEIDASAGNLSG
ncbi:trihelix transcription factor ASIL2-like, partial [Asparagus officinalis]|uniref:trihelix transcription factor ASIL2-like n=1 Tax=Asparagus officinalis TaxID=4686 RepID=UPI00098E655C